MADTVSTQVLTDTTGVKYAVKMTNSSDGTGENLVQKKGPIGPFQYLKDN